MLFAFTIWFKKYSFTPFLPISERILMVQKALFSISEGSVKLFFMNIYFLLDSKIPSFHLFVPLFLCCILLGGVVHKRVIKLVCNCILSNFQIVFFFFFMRILGTWQIIVVEHFIFNCLAKNHWKPGSFITLLFSECVIPILLESCGLFTSCYQLT